MGANTTMLLLATFVVGSFAMHQNLDGFFRIEKLEVNLIAVV
jgi:hypothetical protein